ncbi:MAG: hypothetical protein HYY44_06145 [Deltaproteobacteria bacterium]|nr:hypothetical protein [Deltaproteobacteria bacterium]
MTSGGTGPALPLSAPSVPAGHLPRQAGESPSGSAVALAGGRLLRRSSRSGCGGRALRSCHPSWVPGTNPTN